MKQKRLVKTGLALVSSFILSAGVYAADSLRTAELKRAVDEIITPIMQENDIPGMAVAVTSGGKRYFYNYGLASKESGEPVSEKTLFELGSISKTFTGLLGAYAQSAGFLSLSDPAGRYLSDLNNDVFNQITLLNLATYTAGGFPLQFPDDVENQEQIVAYFKQWRPEYRPGDYRRYSNPSIGLFGYLTAQSMNGDYKALVEKHIFAPLELTHTFIAVPPDKMKYYAYGYSKQGKPIRVNPGPLDAEAYGVKSSAEDMLKFVEANINPSGLPEALQQAIGITQTGYFKVGEMTQGLGWEFYSYPVSLEPLQKGNSAEVAYQANKTVQLTPPQPPESTALFNKTGSTNGFGAYVVFVPEKKAGVVLLANKNYPNPVRIDAAYRILAALE